MIARSACLLFASIVTYGAGLCAAPQALAQGTTSQPVVQALPSPAVQRLNRALVALAKRPRDLKALLQAGDAAIGVDDLDAASGFYARANAIEPSNPLVQMGRASVLLRQGEPTEALALIEDARRGGASIRQVLRERGLAFDMVGAQGRAQADYRRILERERDEEITLRLAISYAIGGQEAKFERILRPLVDLRKPAAFRARAFGLAIMGEQARAAAIAEAVMPRSLAAQIVPYLEVMPRLTPAQQAAAANLGIFPSTANIGRDRPEIARFDPSTVGGSQFTAPPAQSTTTAQAERTDSAPPQGGAAARLEPAGEPLGNPVAPASAASATGQFVVAQDAPRPATPPSPTSEPAKANVADAFADMSEVPDGAASVSEGAVNIAAIDVPLEAEPEPEPEPEPEHPSRIWVQLATGRDVTALGFDWRRFKRRAPDLLEGYEPHTVPWGQANRLLAGPVASRKAARDLVNALKQKGLDTFSYTSPEGSEIQPLK